MKEKKQSGVQILILVSAVFILAALLLSIVSSQKAYSLSHLNNVIIGCAAAIVLEVLAAVLSKSIPEALRDLMLFLAVFADAWAMCTLVLGRTLLAGYIYFSDLEASNPVAVSAMNLAVVAIAAFLISIVLTIIVGFSRRKAE
mgnify:FL=1